ncbi:MAG: asparagine synthase (glutamine-hydrolyzing) [Planctomycetota bacterium]|jgi:asparagine synthase (glutamine-hydrolysing)
MCGIVGYLRLDGQPVDAETVDRMCQTIIHRGPDDMGTYIRGNVGIGMRRLSIIDLQTGRQPISNEDGRLQIVFNGEIYNYKELKSDLVTRGHKFRTESDTEVILHLYEEYSTDCLSHLIGMFAFAVWNQEKQELFCARDRLGIKPFYYFADGKRLIFASELKAILEEKDLPVELDLHALSQFLTFEFIPFPRTLLGTIKKMPPGHFMVANHRGVTLHHYWHPEEVEEENRPENEATEKLYSLLKDAVRLRLRSDVPFGAFLSGGIDSGSIVGLMSELLDNRVRTFSIGFENQSYNELKYARQVAALFDTDHTEHTLNPSAIELIEEIIDHLDDPIGDFSVFPTYLVSKMAREKVKVILSGDGGDELFGGYDTYLAQKAFGYYSKIPSMVRKHLIVPMLNMFPPTDQKKGIINKLKRFTEGARYPEEYEHFRWMIHMNPVTNGNVFCNEIGRGINVADGCQFVPRYLNSNRLNGLNRSMFLDIKTYLVDNILVKVDRMSMARSLEVRVPFLDHRVVEFALSVPPDLKIKRFKTKYLLKKMARRFLPENIVNRPKQGFSIPIKNWLKGPVKPMMTDLLSHDRLTREGILNPDYVNTLMKEHIQNKENHSHRLWSLMLYQLWKERFMSC